MMSGLATRVKVNGQGKVKGQYRNWWSKFQTPGRRRKNRVYRSDTPLPKARLSNFPGHPQLGFLRWLPDPSERGLHVRLHSPFHPSLTPLPLSQKVWFSHDTCWLLIGTCQQEPQNLLFVTVYMKRDHFMQFLRALGP